MEFSRHFLSGLIFFYLLTGVLGLCLGFLMTREIVRAAKEKKAKLNLGTPSLPDNFLTRIFSVWMFICIVVSLFVAGAYAAIQERVGWVKRFHPSTMTQGRGAQQQESSIPRGSSTVN